MLRIQLAQYFHINSILDIYEPIVKNTHISFEYRVPSVEEFTQRTADIIKKYPFVVILNEKDVVVAYGYANQLRYRDAYNWVAELSVYVHPDYKRQKLAFHIYSTLFDFLKLQNVQRVFGVIALPNDDSIQFHEKMGFTLKGTLENVGYKFNQWYSIAFYQNDISNDDLPVNFIPFSNLNSFDLSNVLQNANKRLALKI